MSQHLQKNRLQYERSPYLLQHAQNPVDWYPWGEEAFEKAKREDKLIFLSIGYSACHWCHVMEKESFESEEIAKVLNRYFVSIKVDREERPDIDQIYQLAFQVLHQRGGGWPLSMFLTPEKRPFFGGTYFPPQRRYGMPSFQEILYGVQDAYQNRTKDVKEQAQELTQVLQKISSLTQKETGMISPELVEEAAAEIVKRGDPVYGGTKGAPKFPNTMMLDLVMISASRGDEDAKKHLQKTLQMMHQGGMYDHLGGGFARYSTDEKWLIPHFEKMLYDNAQLARLYTDGSKVLGEDFRPIVAEIFAYVLREMTSREGIFYSAQDADSEGEEGKFFVWTPKEIAEIVGFSDAEIACAYYNVTDAGTFEHGRSVLSRPRPLAEVAKGLQKSEEEVASAIDRIKPKLFEAREKRVKPFRDEKCLASWNGLMISALAEAGATFAQKEWINAAQRALDTWRVVGWSKGRLLHAIKDNEAYGVGFLDDYAGLAVAALDLFSVTGDAATLAFARQLTSTALSLFWDEEAGDFYYTPSDGEVVLYRPKDPHDHAYPGGVGLMANAMLTLATLTGEELYRARAERLLQGKATAARENPMGLSTLVRAIDFAARGPVEIIIAGEPVPQELLQAATSVYVPHRVMCIAANEADARAKRLAEELFMGRAANPDGSPRVYICRGQLCEAPVSSPKAISATLSARP